MRQSLRDYEPHFISLETDELSWNTLFKAVYTLGWLIRDREEEGVFLVRVYTFKERLLDEVGEWHRGTVVTVWKFYCGNIFDGAQPGSLFGLTEDRLWQRLCGVWLRFLGKTRTAHFHPPGHCLVCVVVGVRSRSHHVLRLRGLRAGLRGAHCWDHEPHREGAQVAGG